MMEDKIQLSRRISKNIDTYIKHISITLIAMPFTYYVNSPLASVFRKQQVFQTLRVTFSTVCNLTLGCQNKVALSQSIINLTSCHTCCVCSHLFKSTKDNYPSEVKRPSDSYHNYCV
jgi:hypothetical protein